VIFSLIFTLPAWAGSEELKATKRIKFLDDSVESMQEGVAQHDEEIEEYRKKMLENSEKTVKLLERILVLLHELKEEKQ
jgi:hypothetical protein